MNGMYLNYEILLHGYKTIYLGEHANWELEDLKNILVLSFMYRTWQCNPKEMLWMFKKCQKNY
jgi:hypothetical protein